MHVLRLPDRVASCRLPAAACGRHRPDRLRPGPDAGLLLDRLICSSSFCSASRARAISVRIARASLLLATRLSIGIRGRPARYHAAAAGMSWLAISCICFGDVFKGGVLRVSRRPWQGRGWSLESSFVCLDAVAWRRQSSSFLFRGQDIPDGLNLMPAPAFNWLIAR